MRNKPPPPPPVASNEHTLAGRDSFDHGFFALNDADARPRSISEATDASSSSAAPFPPDIARTRLGSAAVVGRDSGIYFRQRRFSEVTKQDTDSAAGSSAASTRTAKGKGLLRRLKGVSVSLGGRGVVRCRGQALGEGDGDGDGDGSCTIRGHLIMSTTAAVVTRKHRWVSLQAAGLLSMNPHFDGVPTLEVLQRPAFVFYLDGVAVFITSNEAGVEVVYSIIDGCVRFPLGSGWTALVVDRLDGTK